MSAMDVFVVDSRRRNPLCLALPVASENSWTLKNHMCRKRQCEGQQTNFFSEIGAFPHVDCALQWSCHLVVSGEAPLPASLSTAVISLWRCVKLASCSKWLGD